MNKKLTKLHAQAERISDKLLKAYKKKPTEKQEQKVTKLTERSHDLYSQIIAVMGEERKEMDTRAEKWRTTMQHSQQTETQAAKIAGKAKKTAGKQ